MRTYYLRFEGVNLQYFIGDCKDLNTIRGGGLALLDAALEFEKDNPDFRRISTGASAGWYSFGAENPEAAEELIKAARAWLREGALAHATIVSDWFEETQLFERDREALLALNRYGQAQSPSVVYPLEEREGPYFVCDLDGVRPAENEIQIGQDQAWVSNSVKQRRDYGRDQKKRMFYERVNAEGAERVGLPESFARSFDDIAFDPGQGNLHQKLAVIHLDGNKFGAIQNHVCRDEEAQTKWDKAVQASRLGWLRSHLRLTSQNPHWLGRDRRYRMEVLLWGGDEIILVVPAWFGSSTLEHFFDCTSDLMFADRPLTYSAGMVFCHQKASIHTITDLARKLSEEAKAEKPLNNVFAYQVLESFDTLGSEFDAKRLRLVPGHSTREALTLAGPDMKKMREDLARVQRFLPRRKLQELARSLLLKEERAPALANALDDEMKEYPEWIDLRQVSGIDRISNRPDSSFWIHLNELWDYIPEAGL